jgi:hypothetical protein
MCAYLVIIQCYHTLIQGHSQVTALIDEECNMVMILNAQILVAAIIIAIATASVLAQHTGASYAIL